MSEPLLPALARLIGEWFPELEKRSIAVSESAITAENVPTLPLAMVSLIRGEPGVWVWQAASSKTEMLDDFMVEFWLPPVKIRRADGSETPFWAFYDYEALRNRLLSHIVGYFGPRGQRIEYRSTTVEAEQYAVVVSFRLIAHLKWCADPEVTAESGDGQPARVAINICRPKSDYCGPAFEPQEDCDPCTSE